MLLFVFKAREDGILYDGEIAFIIKIFNFNIIELESIRLIKHTLFNLVY